MTRNVRVLLTVATVFVLLVTLPPPPVHTQGRTTMTTIATEEDFFRALKELSNWGRWGKDDQLGSANLVTAQKRKHAVALVKTGTTVSLAHNPLTERAEDNSNPFEHTMLRGFSMDR